MSGPNQFESEPEEGWIDDLFLTLADERRRSVLYFFRSSENDVATVAELIEYTAQTCPGVEMERLEVSFHHAILPRLAEANIIEYDSRSQTVRYRGHPLLEKMLDLIAPAEVAP